MPELTPEITLYILAAVTLAGLVHGTLGLGFPLTATPLLALVMEIQSAILITLLPNIAVNILSIADGGGWRHSINRYWPLALYAVAGTALGTAVLLHADPAPMKLLLALLILLYLNLERIGRLDLRWITARPRLAMLLFGLSAGFAAGTANVMVPILVIFTLEAGLAAGAMVQLFNLCFLVGKSTQLGMFTLAGVLPGAMPPLVLPVLAAAVAALLIGMAIRRRIAGDSYRRLLRRVLLVMALPLGLQFLLAVAA
ncbi:MAG: TSUP family transporter [gamma proteobacterium symbiont of Phacoides pectinatus]